MTTLRKLIKDSLKHINALAPGEEPTADDMDIALRSLVSLVDSLSNDLLNIYTVKKVYFPLTANQTSYKLGPKYYAGELTGADWIIDRPMRVEDVKVLLDTEEQVLTFPTVPDLNTVITLQDNFTGALNTPVRTPLVGENWLNLANNVVLRGDGTASYANVSQVMGLQSNNAFTSQFTERRLKVYWDRTQTGSGGIQNEPVFYLSSPPATVTQPGFNLGDDYVGLVVDLRVDLVPELGNQRVANSSVFAFLQTGLRGPIYGGTANNQLLEFVIPFDNSYCEIWCSGLKIADLGGPAANTFPLQNLDTLIFNHNVSIFNTRRWISLNSVNFENIGVLDEDGNFLDATEYGYSSAQRYFWDDFYDNNVALSSHVPQIGGGWVGSAAFGNSILPADINVPTISYLDFGFFSGQVVNTSFFSSNTQPLTSTSKVFVETQIQRRFNGFSSSAPGIEMILATDKDNASGDHVRIAVDTQSPFASNNFAVRVTGTLGGQSFTSNSFGQFSNGAAINVRGVVDGDTVYVYTNRDLVLTYQLPANVQGYPWTPGMRVYDNGSTTSGTHYLGIHYFMAGTEGSYTTIRTQAFNITSSTESATTGGELIYVTLQQDQLIEIGTTNISGASANGDTYIRLYNGDGDVVAFNDDYNNSLASYLVYQAPATGVYTIRVGGYGDQLCAGTVAWRITSA